MCNFYRWYPEGKILFMAPTRPLVRQQMESVLSTMEIDHSDAVELTGNQPPNSRIALWQSKHIFFGTPHTIQNDLLSNTGLTDSIVLVVVDEAHKALGNYACCNVIKELLESPSACFRILALTATPATNVSTVQHVIDNLLIQ